MNIVQNDNAVNTIVETIESFKLVSGSFVGKPFVVLEWQRNFINGIFGKWNSETRTRIVTEALLTIAKKNGKTELVAAITLCFCIIPFLQQQEGEIVIVSGTREQAYILFNVIKKFIEYDKTLIPHFVIIPSKKMMIHKKTGMHIKIIAADIDSSQGINPYIVIVDEIGNIPKDKAQKLLDGLANAFGAQEQPLLVMLSTQSPDMSHPFSLKVDYANKINDVNDKTENIEFHGAVYSVPDEDDVLNEDNWIKANPSIVAIPTIKKQLRKSIETAQYNPASMARVRAFLMNQRYSGEVHFLTQDTWMKCKSDYDIADLKGCKAWGGLDLAGGRNDLSSLQLIVQDRQDELYVVSYFWSANDGLYDRAERDNVPYIEWKKQGYLTTTPGQTTDWRYMTQMLVDISNDFEIEDIFYDRWKIYEIQRELDEIGDDLPLTPIGQGFKDATPCVDALENMVYNVKFWHNNPILTWNVSNTVLSVDPAGGKKFDKKKAIGRIDGCVALGMAARCYEVNNITTTDEILFI